MAHAPSSRPDPQAVRALFAWYAAMGVDEAVGLTPVDRTAISETPAPPTAPPRAPAPPDAVATARTLAARCDTLEALRAAMEAFDQCPLKDTAGSLVFADGNPAAAVMFIGEAPGQEEDRQGKPFVGRSGKLLDRMLQAIGLDRTQAYIANILPWRPPLNRKPELTEVQMCLPFLHRHIALAAPQLIVTLGGTASQHLLDTQDSMRNLRGRWRPLSLEGRTVHVMPTYHPAYLLRNPISKRAAWQDMLAVHQRLKEGE